MPKYCLALVLLVSYALAAEPPKLRLPGDVSPVKYRVSRYLARFEGFAREAKFSGKIAIELDVHTPGKIVWLNARNLTIDHAEFSSAGRSQTAKVEPGGKEFTGFSLPGSIPAHSTLQIAYHGPFKSKNGCVLFEIHYFDPV